MLLLRIARRATGAAAKPPRGLWDADSELRPGTPVYQV